jgi:hypothetical protein
MESLTKKIGDIYPKAAQCANKKQRMQQLTEEHKKKIAQNVEYLYAYLDMYLDTMTKDEIDMWRIVLSEIDPEFKNNTDNE